MKTLKEKIEVMQAAEQGQKIELLFYPLSKNHWVPVQNPKGLTWNWEKCDYRIKRIKPGPLVRYLIVYEQGNTKKVDTSFLKREQAEEYLQNSKYLKKFRNARVIKLQEVEE